MAGCGRFLIGVPSQRIREGTEGYHENSGSMALLSRFKPLGLCSSLLGYAFGYYVLLHCVSAVLHFPLRKRSSAISWTVFKCY